MEHTIRRLGPGDEQALADFTARDHRFERDPAEAIPNAPLDPEAARTFLADTDVLFWLAEDEDEPVGMLLAHIQRSRKSGAWAWVNIVDVGTDVTWRGRGVARSLLAELERWMHVNDVHEARVSAPSRTEGFYASCGFAPDDRVAMVRVLVDDER